MKPDVYGHSGEAETSCEHNAQYRHTLSWYGDAANLHIKQLKSSFIWSHVVAIWQIEAHFSHILFALLLVP